jgi:phytanoyl-CoA hydroxylase
MLSPDQVRQYHDDGYALLPGYLNPGEVTALLEDIEGICAGSTVARHDPGRMEMEPRQGPEGTRVRRLYEPCTFYQRFRALSDSDRLLDTVEPLLGPSFVFHYSKINMKPPAIGSVVEWHQDLAYYPLTNPDSLAVLFYLDDATLTNGCLQVIPGAHRGPILDHSRDGIFQGRVTAPIDPPRAVSLEAPAGSAILMHSLTPHASAPNTSTTPRRTLILSYRAADAFPVYVGEMTVLGESHTRHVRGIPPTQARFSGEAVPVPRYPQQVKSLYELQELARRVQAKEIPS